MKITAKPIQADDLRSGDIFSAYDQVFFDNVIDSRAQMLPNAAIIGFTVYIRTDVEATLDLSIPVYLLTIEQEGV